MIEPRGRCTLWVSPSANEDVACISSRDKSGRNGLGALSYFPEERRIEEASIGRRVYSSERQLPFCLEEFARQERGRGTKYCRMGYQALDPDQGTRRQGPALLVIKVKPGIRVKETRRKEARDEEQWQSMKWR